MNGFNLNQLTFATILVENRFFGKNMTNNRQNTATEKTGNWKNERQSNRLRTGVGQCALSHSNMVHIRWETDVDRSLNRLLNHLYKGARDRPAIKTTYTRPTTKLASLLDDLNNTKKEIESKRFFFSVPKPSFRPSRWRDFDSYRRFRRPSTEPQRITVAVKRDVCPNNTL